MGSADPLVFSLQHFCLHDGPGIRSIVFFKGCPLRCAWCQNVESWNRHAEIAFKAHLCIGCTACVKNCPAHAMQDIGKRDKDRCLGCHTCIKNCPSGAMTLFGTSRSPESILEELRPEFPLFRTSGGGVTFSGGEPALHPEFVAGIAGALGREGIESALETCGCFDLEKAWTLIREVAYLLFDIKLFREEDHRRFCGAGNRVIKDNLRSLARDCGGNTRPLLWPRFPLVPGITGGEENIRGWAELLQELGIPRVTIVPYHPMGENKRRWLGLAEGPAIRIPDEEELLAAETLFNAGGIRVYRSGEEDWNIRNAGQSCTEADFI